MLSEKSEGTAGFSNLISILVVSNLNLTETILMKNSEIRIKIAALENKTPNTSGFAKKIELTAVEQKS